MIGSKDLTASSCSSNSLVDDRINNGKRLIDQVIKKIEQGNLDFSDIINLETITLDELRYRTTEDPHKGKSLLWFLAEINRFIPGLMDVVWERFKSDFTLNDFRVSALEGDEKGETILFGFRNNGSMLMKIWEKFKSDFTLDDFRVRSLGQLNEWPLLNWLPISNYALFVQVWEKFKEDFSRNDFTSRGEQSDVTTTLMWWLVNSAARFSSESVQTILYQFLSQMPDIFSEEDLCAPVSIGPTIDYLITSNPNLDAKIRFLIQARNVFFTAVRLAQETLASDGELTPVCLQELINLADIAFVAGYLNAFYDLGKFLVDEYPLEACEAYKKVPESSWYVKKLSVHLTDIAERYYILAIEPGNQANDRKEILEYALSFALIAPRQMRDPIINRIAYSYLKSDGFNINMNHIRMLVSEFLLDFIDKDPTVERCIKVFEEVKSRILIEDELCVLKGLARILLNDTSCSMPASSSSSLELVSDDATLLTQFEHDVNNKRSVPEEGNRLESSCSSSKRHRGPG